MRTFMSTVVCMLTFTVYTVADTIDIKPEYIEQMDYKISQLMPCNWDQSATVFGYYGELPEQKESESQLEQMQAWRNAKSQLTKIDLALATEEAFGFNLNLAFTPEMMQNDGMPLQIVEVEYGTLNKKCESGFGTGLFTR